MNLRTPIVRCPICEKEMKYGVERFSSVPGEHWAECNEVLSSILYVHDHPEENITVEIYLKVRNQKMD